MSILIKQARIIFPGSPSNNKVADILIEGGKIAEIRKNIPQKGNVKVIEADGLCVSPGWIDMQAVSCDPGYEHKETLETMADCAAAGGFTGVCVHSYTQPALHNKSQIEYLLNRSRNSVVDIYPVGTITVDGNGKDLSEMYDMKQSGSVAFSDHKQPLKDAGAVMRALQYAANAGSFVITHCRESSISHGGQMNEGETAVMLGLKGIPALAEELMLQRNLSVLEYTGGKLHIPTVSSKGSVDMIRKAKAAGLKVTAGVSSLHLLLDETALKEFDTNFKLDPPLRSKRDVQALRNAVENGVIDVIVSDHLPQDVESKELEFDHAEEGAINLQTAFCCAFEALGEENLETIVSCLAVNTRKILGLKSAVIAEGESAELTLFTTRGETILTEKNNLSRSKNSPLLDRPLKGKVIGIINGSKSRFH